MGSQWKAFRSWFPACSNSDRRLPTGRRELPKRISPRTIGQVTIRSPSFNPNIHFSTRGSALISSLMAFVSSRHVTAPFTCQTARGRAQGVVLRQWRRPGHPLLRDSGEVVPEWFEARIEGMSPDRGEIANVPAPVVPRSSVVPPQPAPNYVQDHLEFGSSFLLLSQDPAAVTSALNIGPRIGHRTVLGAR